MSDELQASIKPLSLASTLMQGGQLQAVTIGHTSFILIYFKQAEQAKRHYSNCLRVVAFYN